MENFDELLENEEFAQIRGYPNYCISNMGRCYNKKTERFIGSDCNGYIRVSLHNSDGQQSFDIHRLVMSHFGPPKPDGDFEIDHINRNPADNRIENLRWLTGSENCKNRGSNNGIEYQFFDELPNVDEAILVLDYGKWNFEDLFFVDNHFYFFNGIQYRQLHINYDKKGYAYVYAYDIDGRQRKICYTKFKKIYGLI